VLFVPVEEADKTIEICFSSGYQAAVCGKVVTGNRSVEII